MTTPTDKELRALAEAVAHDDEMLSKAFNIKKTVDYVVEECGLPAASAQFIAAANPARILALLDENDKLAGEISDEKILYEAMQGLMAEVSSERDSLRTQLSEVTAERDAAYEGLKPFSDTARALDEDGSGPALFPDAEPINCAHFGPAFGYNEWPPVRWGHLRKAAQLIQSKEGA